jgi:molecular chaperone DnaK (HSP70)
LRHRLVSQINVVFDVDANGIINVSAEGWSRRAKKARRI